MSQPAPGWYPDPAGSQRLRWWNGGEWTEQFHDMAQQGAPVAQQMPADQTAGQYIPAQSQAPIVSSDPYNPAGVAPQLGAAGMDPQAGDAAPKRSGPILMAPIAAPNATTTNSASRGEDAKREAIAFRVPVARPTFPTTVILPALRTSRIGYTGARN